MQYDNPTPARRQLSDILNGKGVDLREVWDKTAEAPDFTPLPAGTYTAHVLAVEFFKAKTGTPGVKIQFRICEGEHVGRMLFHDCWLTPAAMPQTKRDMGKLGLFTIEQLENATVPPGRIRCKVRVSLRTDDDGTQRNRVRGFDVVSVDEPTADPFSPSVGATNET